MTAKLIWAALAKAYTWAGFPAYGGFLMWKLQAFEKTFDWSVLLNGNSYLVSGLFGFYVWHVTRRMKEKTRKIRIINDKLEKTDNPELIKILTREQKELEMEGGC